jgi:parallel beta-helix repeat protein
MKRLLLVLLFAGIPVMATGTDKIIDVTAYGAQPDDGAEDTAALEKLIADCADRKNITIVFPPGRYDFEARPNRAVSMVFENFDGLTIEGKGAELSFNGLTGAFLFQDCRNVTLRHLRIDWKRPPFSQGTVIATGEKHFDIEVQEAYPVSGGEAVQAAMSYDTETGLPAKNGIDIYHQFEKTELIAPRTLRVHQKRELPIREGMLLVLRHQVYAYNAFYFRHSENIRVEDCTVYTCPGMGLPCESCEDITVRNLQVRIRPDSGRLLSTTADATHFNNCAGTIAMTDCLFEGMGDDASNFHGMYLSVVKIEDGQSVLAHHKLGFSILPAPGESVEFASGKTLLPFAAGSVTAVTRDVDENLHRITFADPLPPALSVDDLIGNTTRLPKVRVQNCTVRGNRARGFLLQVRDSLVEDCRFEHCSAGGILIISEIVHFRESIGTRNAVIRNNTFIGCNLGAARCEGAITATACLPDWSYAPAGVHRDLLIENNRIENTGEAGIFIGCTDGAVLRNNTIENACLTRQRKEGRAAIYLRNARNITMKENNITLNAPETVPLYVDTGCDAATLRCMQDSINR